VAAVTGGGAGIGAAICRRLAAEGAAVAVLDLSQAAAERTAEELGGGLALAVDVSDSGQVERAVQAIENERGPLEIFVNNAGATGIDHVRRVTPLLERQREEVAADGVARTPLDAVVRLTDDEWRHVLAVHLDGTFYGTRAAARVMSERGRGVIVNMASVCGIEGCNGHPHYSAAKAAILGFTRSVAKELIVQGIRVNAVAPGFVDTSRKRASPGADRTAEVARTLGASRRAEIARTAAGRLGTTEEIAATIAFLASDDAGYFVGATLSPNGGLLTAV
jgi:3-oxoacyl-[acyl-carrier protein] reductase